MNISLVINKKAEFKIAVPDSASLVEKTVSAELQEYIKKATGAMAEIVEESKAEGTVIYVGHTEYAKKNSLLGNSKENWIIKAIDGNIVLTGGLDNCDRGVAYSVYHFLEDYLGVHWWSYAEEYVPRISDFSVPGDIYDNKTPAVPHRKIIETFTHKDFVCQARNRMNIIGDDGIEGGAFREDVKALGGAIPFGPPHHVHSFPLYFPAEVYFDEHPDWWAYNEVLDKRIDFGQLCLSNEGLYQEMLKKLLDNIEAENKKSEETNTEKPCFYSISFADKPFTCECPKCKETIKNAGISGYALKFVNRLAKDVAKIHPDVLLETLAYMRYIEPPLDDTVPEKNVMIRYADIPQSSLHSINHPVNAGSLRRIKEWSKLCSINNSPLVIWDYLLHMYPSCPMPQVYRIIENVKMAYAKGVKGYMVENETECPRDFWALDQWVLNRIIEDPTLDGETLINTFLKNYYGAADKYIKEYLDMTNEIAVESNFAMRLDEPVTLWNYATLELVEKGTEIFAKAEKAVEGDKLLSSRVRIAKLGLLNVMIARYWEFKNAKKAKGEEFDYDLGELANEAINAVKTFERIYAFDCDGVYRHKAVSKTVKRDIGIYKDLAKRTDEKFPLPAELSHINPADITDIYAKNIIRFFDGKTGEAIIEDDGALVDKVLKLSRKDMSAQCQSRYAVTTADAAMPQPLSFFVKIKNTEEKVYDAKLDVYKEDIVTDKYHLYKLEGVKGITPKSNLVLYIINQRDISVNVSEICKLMPFEECDIYISMKATGEFYGGSADDEDALYFERFIIVKTK